MINKSKAWSGGPRAKFELSTNSKARQSGIGSSAKPRRSFSRTCLSRCYGRSRVGTQTRTVQIAAMPHAVARSDRARARRRGFEGRGRGEARTPNTSHPIDGNPTLICYHIGAPSVEHFDGTPEHCEVEESRYKRRLKTPPHLPSQNLKQDSYSISFLARMVLFLHG
jgi:hypothetical protein